MLIRIFWAGCFALLSSAVAFGPVRAQPVDRDIRELRLDTNAAITRSKSAVDGELTAAIVDLCSLHLELVRHERFASSLVLAGARARIASRLEDMKRDLEKSGSPESMDLDKYGQSRLRERLMAGHIRFSGAWMVGPAIEGLALAGNFAPNDAWAADLINLIQQTINPDTWQSNGGDSVIAFWAPTQSLVVSANMLTHDRIEALLIGLRGR